MDFLWQWLWQGLLVAACAVAGVRLIPAFAAAKRHLVLWLGLLGVAAWPLLLAGLGPAPRVPPVLPVAPDAVVMVAPPPDWLLQGVAGLWLAVAVVGIGRILAGLLALRAVVRRSWAFDAARALQLPLWRAASAHSARRVELRVSREIDGACAFGWRRPVILLSAELVNGLDDEALDAVVLHELAHHERRDTWTCLLQRAVVALTALHPAVHWLSRRIDVEREVACDERVITRTGTAWRYSRALAHAASVVLHAGASAPRSVPGSSTAPSLLRLRVRRAIAPRVVRSAWWETATCAAGAAAVVLAMVAAPHAPRVLVFAHAPEQLLLEAVHILAAGTLPSADAPLALREAPSEMPGGTASAAVVVPLPAALSSSAAAPEFPAIAAAFPSLASEPVAERPADSRSLDATPLPAIALPMVASADAEAGSDRTLAGPFVALGGAVGTAGANIGSGASRAGASIGRFFKSGGQAIARTF